MKQDAPARLSPLDRLFVGCLLVVFGGIVVHAPLTVWLGTVWPNTVFLIKSWKEVVMGVALLLMAIILTRRRQWGLMRNRPIALIALFAALNLVLIPVFYGGFEQTIAGLFINLRYVLFFGLVFVALRLYPQLSRLFIKVFVAGALVVVGFALLQMTVLPHDILKYIGYGKDTIMPYLTVDRNPDYIRINSTLRGPNPLGAYAIIVLTAMLAVWLRGPKKLKKQQLWIVAGLGLGSVLVLWTSYSRSAALGALAAVALVLFAVYGRRIHRNVWFGLGAVGLVLGGSLVVLHDARFVSQVILHEDPVGGSSVNSNDGHATSLLQASRLMAQQPFGAGIGSTGSASLLGKNPLIIENQYLFVAHETGWAGLVLFLYLHYVVLSRLWRRRQWWLALAACASGVGLLVAGLFLPVWADDTVSIIWWGLAAIGLAGVPVAVAASTKTHRQPRPAKKSKKGPAQ